MTTTDDTNLPPKLFISYSWSDQAHMDWVLQLATDLRANGVDAILDKWHLREGQDAHAFMEQMVSDPNVQKVVLICDKKYVERADQREGGVGAESQIMSGELYGRADQTKFVAICREGDENGRAYLPIFMRNRIYIDLRYDEEYSSRFSQLLRWAFGKPFYVEPEMGSAPSFLDEVSAPIVREISIFDRSVSYTTRSTISDATTTFFKSAIRSSSDFTATLPNGPGGDDIIYEQILTVASVIAKVLEVVERAAQDSEAAQTVSIEFHNYLEAILGNYEKGSTQWSSEVTKFYGEFLLVCFVGILIRNRKFSEIEQFLGTPFALFQYEGITARPVSYTRLSSYLRSLEARNSRLNLRRASIHSDLLKHICELIGFDFKEFMQADLVLFLRSTILGDRWWPHSLLYAADKDGAFPWFLRAVTIPLRDQMLSIIGIKSKAQLEKMISNFKDGSISDPSWSSAFSTVRTQELANLDAILKSF